MYPSASVRSFLFFHFSHMAEDSHDKQNLTKKILFLHGFGNNAEIMKQATSKLCKQLQGKRYQCVFLDAPHNIQADDSKGAMKERAWFIYNPEQKMEYKSIWGQDSVYYHGLEETLSYLQNFWLENGPFDAVFGFSQGASLAALIAAHGKEFASIKCVVCWSGFYKPTSKQIPFYDHINVPSLHVYGANDDCVSNERSKELAERFIHSTIYQHQGTRAHGLSSKASDRQVVVDFLVKHLCG